MGKTLEVAGGILLLASFVFQNYIYDKFNERETELRQAMLERAVIDKSILLNEALFFLAASASTERQQYPDLPTAKLREAARKLAMSEMMAIGPSDLPPAEKGRLLSHIQRSAANVSDYRSYVQLLHEINAINRTYRPPAFVLQDVSASRNRWRHGFLAVYVLGSIMLLVGLGLKE